MNPLRTTQLGVEQLEDRIVPATPVNPAAPDILDGRSLFVVGASLDETVDYDSDGHRNDMQILLNGEEISHLEKDDTVSPLITFDGLEGRSFVLPEIVESDVLGVVRIQNGGGHSHPVTVEDGGLIQRFPGSAHLSVDFLNEDGSHALRKVAAIHITRVNDHGHATLYIGTNDPGGWKNQVLVVEEGGRITVEADHVSNIAIATNASGGIFRIDGIELAPLSADETDALFREMGSASQATQNEAEEDTVVSSTVLSVVHTEASLVEGTERETGEEQERESPLMTFEELEGQSFVVPQHVELDRLGVVRIQNGGGHAHPVTVEEGGLIQRFPGSAHITVDLLNDDGSRAMREDIAAIHITRVSDQGNATLYIGTNHSSGWINQVVQLEDGGRIEIEDDFISSISIATNGSGGVFALDGIEFVSDTPLLPEKSETQEILDPIVRQQLTDVALMQATVAYDTAVKKLSEPIFAGFPETLVTRKEAEQYAHDHNLTPDYWGYARRFADLQRVKREALSTINAIEHGEIIPRFEPTMTVLATEGSTVSLLIQNPSDLSHVSLKGWEGGLLHEAELRHEGGGVIQVAQLVIDDAMKTGPYEIVLRENERGPILAVQTVEFDSISNTVGIRPEEYSRHLLDESDTSVSYPEELLDDGRQLVGFAREHGIPTVDRVNMSGGLMNRVRHELYVNSAFYISGERWEQINEENGFPLQHTGEASDHYTEWISTLMHQSVLHMFNLWQGGSQKEALNALQGSLDSLYSGGYAHKFRQLGQLGVKLPTPLEILKEGKRFLTDNHGMIEQWDRLATHRVNNPPISGRKRVEHPDIALPDPVDSSGGIRVLEYEGSEVVMHTSSLQFGNRIAEELRQRGEEITTLFTQSFQRNHLTIDDAKTTFTWIEQNPENLTRVLQHQNAPLSLIDRLHDTLIPQVEASEGNSTQTLETAVEALNTEERTVWQEVGTYVSNFVSGLEQNASSLTGWVWDSEIQRRKVQTGSGTTVLDVLPPSRPEAEHAIREQLRTSFPIKNLSEYKWDLGSGFHYGTANYHTVDLNGINGRNTDYGDPLYAVDAGHISSIEPSWGAVTITHRHPDGFSYETRYGHVIIQSTNERGVYNLLDKHGKLIRSIKVGNGHDPQSKVDAQEYFAAIGNTGKEPFYAHLDFVVRYDGQSVDMTSVLVDAGIPIYAADSGADGNFRTEDGDRQFQIEWNEDLQALVPINGNPDKLVYDTSAQALDNDEYKGGKAPTYWLALEGDDVSKMERVVWVETLSSGEKVNGWLKINDYSQQWNPSTQTWTTRK